MNINSRNFNSNFNIQHTTVQLARSQMHTATVHRFADYARVLISHGWTKKKWLLPIRTRILARHTEISVCFLCKKFIPQYWVFISYILKPRMPSFTYSPGWTPCLKFKKLDKPKNKLKYTQVYATGELVVSGLWHGGDWSSHSCQMLSWIVSKILSRKLVTKYHAQIWKHNIVV